MAAFDFVPSLLRPRTAVPPGAASPRVGFVRTLGTAIGLAMVAMVGASRAQDAMPPAVQFDIHRLELVEAASKERHRDVLILIDRMRKLGQPMPPETSFLEGKAFFGMGALVLAQRSLAAYLKVVGREGKDYDEALRLYVRIKTELAEKARADREAAALYADFLAARKAWSDEKDRVADWKKRAVVYGGPGDDSAAAMARGADGVIVLAGSLHVRKSQDDKQIEATLPWITAFDVNGRRIWHRPLGLAGDAGVLRSAVEVPGRGFLFGGVQKGYQIAAMTDRLGNVLSNGDGDPWIIGFALASGGEGGIVRLLRNGEILALGTVEIGKDETSGKASARLPVAVRLSPKGKGLGQTVLAQGAAARWHDVKDALVLDDGDVVIAGEARRVEDDATSAEGYLIRIKPDGQEVWSQRVTPTQAGGGAITALAAAADGIVFVGRDGARLGYGKYRVDGTPVWRRTIEAPRLRQEFARLCAADDFARRLAEAPQPKGKKAAPIPDSELAEVRVFACRDDKGKAYAAATGIVARPKRGYVILGIAGEDGSALTRITMTAIDPAGEVIWRQAHGDGPVNIATAALGTGDGGFVVAGVTSNWGRDVLAFKSNAAGKLGPFAALGPPAAPKPDTAKTAPAKPEPPKKDAAKAVAKELPKKEASKTDAAKKDAKEAPKKAVPKTETAKTETPKAKTAPPGADGPEADTKKAPQESIALPAAAKPDTDAAKPPPPSDKDKQAGAAREADRDFGAPKSARPPARDDGASYSLGDLFDGLFGSDTPSPPAKP